MTVKTVFLCDVSVCRNLCLKLEKVDKGDGTRHVGQRNCADSISMFSKLQKLLTAN